MLLIEIQQTEAQCNALKWFRYSAVQCSVQRWQREGGGVGGSDRRWIVQLYSLTHHTRPSSSSLPTAHHRVGDDSRDDDDDCLADSSWDFAGSGLEAVLTDLPNLSQHPSPTGQTWRCIVPLEDSAFVVLLCCVALCCNCKEDLFWHEVLLRSQGIREYPWLFMCSAFGHCR